MKGNVIKIAPWNNTTNTQLGVCGGGESGAKGHTEWTAASRYPSQGPGSLQQPYANRKLRLVIHSGRKKVNFPFFRVL